MSAADKLHEFAEMLAAARARSQAASTVAEPLAINRLRSASVDSDRESLVRRLGLPLVRRNANKHRRQISRPRHLPV
jgi:hypothetical protein